MKRTLLIFGIIGIFMVSACTTLRHPVVRTPTLSPIVIETKAANTLLPTATLLPSSTPFPTETAMPSITPFPAGAGSCNNKP